MIRKMGWLLFVSLILITPPKVEATIKSLPAAADTYINGTSGSTDVNYSYHPTLRLSGQLSNYFVILLKFPVDQIPSNQEINSAKLKLYFRQMINSDQLTSTPLNISYISSSWSEATTAWINRPNKGDSFQPEPELRLNRAEAGYQEWEIAPLVQKWVNGEVQNYGIYLEVPISDWSCGFDSVEGEYAPKLVVDYGSSMTALIQPITKLLPKINLLITSTPTPSSIPTATPTEAAPATPNPTLMVSPSKTPTNNPSGQPMVTDIPQPSIRVSTSPPTQARLELKTKTDNQLTNWLGLGLGLVAYGSLVTAAIKALQALKKREIEPSQRLITDLMILITIGYLALSICFGYLLLPRLLGRL